MFGRRQRRKERLYWEGFRDALVHGAPQGFEDGKQAAKRIHRDALVSEVSRLSLNPGDKLVVKVKALTADTAEAIKGQLKPRFPDNEILVCDEATDLSVVEAHPTNESEAALA